MLMPVPDLFYKEGKLLRFKQKFSRFGPDRLNTSKGEYHLCYRGVAGLLPTYGIQSGSRSGRLDSVASLLWLNVWRGMVMSDKPFRAVLNDKHGEARWPRQRLALFHPGKLVKAGD